MSNDRNAPQLTATHRISPQCASSHRNAPSHTQVDVEEYFKSGKHKARPLENPLAAEFGIYSERDLDEFILNHLPTFALVRYGLVVFQAKQ